MGHLVVIVTSPNLPAGLLSGSSWRAVFEASRVAAPATSRLTDLVSAVRAEGVAVDLWNDPTAAALAQAADRLGPTGSLVWLADPDDPAFARDLAQLVVESADRGAGGSEPGVEVIVGSYDRPGSTLLDLVAVMDRLRRECPWDREQTHSSLVQYLLEETHETIEAIEDGDADHLREELGDLLLQVLFHARIAEEDLDSGFTIDDVAADIAAKLIRRHPHVFEDLDVSGVADVESNWEIIKQREKSRRSVLDGIPLGLPALALADKVVARSLRSSSSPDAPAASTTPAKAAPSGYTAASLGDALFALVVAARAAGIDPEQALRQRVRAEIAAVRAAEDAASPG